LGVFERDHWNRVWSATGADEMSWFEASPGSSMAMIDALGLEPDAPIVDVGGGASGLSGQLIARGHTDVTVVDISGEAIRRARGGFGESDRVNWIVADVRDHDFGRRFALWHDRAAFHFMVSEEDREGYVATLRRSLVPGGDLILATFGADGPDSCSGLPVQRYSAGALAEAIGGDAELVSCHTEDHCTPSGASQQFLFAHLRMRGRG
jgi:SAM-dependent methyltransferase